MLAWQLRIWGTCCGHLFICFITMINKHELSTHMDKLTYRKRWLRGPMLWKSMKFMWLWLWPCLWLWLHPWLLLWPWLALTMREVFFKKKQIYIWHSPDLIWKFWVHCYQPFLHLKHGFQELKPIPKCWEKCYLSPSQLVTIDNYSTRLCFDCGCNQTF